MLRFDDLAEIDPYSNAIFADIPDGILARVTMGIDYFHECLIPWFLVGRCLLESKKGEERENFETATMEALFSLRRKV